MKELKERNNLIRYLRKKGLTYRELGLYFHMSRQCAHQIDHKKQDGFWGRLFVKVLYLLKDY